MCSHLQCITDKLWHSVASISRSNPPLPCRRSRVDDLQTEGYHSVINAGSSWRGRDKVRVGGEATSSHEARCGCNFLVQPEAEGLAQGIRLAQRQRGWGQQAARQITNRMSYLHPS